MNLEDILIAARTIFGEARGEPYEGQKAVGHVILNRAAKEGSVAGVCLRPKQFSCWNLGDPTRERMVQVTIDDPKFRTALKAFLDAVEELDWTNGATHYFNPQLASPKWAEGKQPIVVVGRHKFFNDIPW
jgi:N-acetylmuramoyl-L-alanine amidase